MKSSFISIIALVLIAAPVSGLARGAFVIESQYGYEFDNDQAIVSPFLDLLGQPWVLAFHMEDAQCLLIGPFDTDNPPLHTWRLPDGPDGPIATVCLRVEPGPDDGYFIRGFIPPPAFSNDPPLGFLALTDESFVIRWLVEDEPLTELGSYGEPLDPVAWSPTRGRVLTFFLAFASLGPSQMNQLHGVSIADTTGLVRRTISSWGRVSNGTLESLLVFPTEGDFLIIAHANGTEMLVYDGLENVSTYPGGDVDWLDQSVLHAQFSPNGNLYLVHVPRLDLSGLEGHITSLSEDGQIQYYSRSISREMSITHPLSGEPADLAFRRPILNYLTESTLTLVRSSQLEYVFHVFDPFNGAELAIQPLSSLDDHSPTHLGQASQSDHLILLANGRNQSGQPSRFLSLIRWDPTEPTPGPYQIPPIDNGLDTDLDAGRPLDPSGTNGAPGDDGCCQLAPLDSSRPSSLLVVLGLVAHWFWRRTRGGGFIALRAGERG